MLGASVLLALWGCTGAPSPRSSSDHLDEDPRLPGEAIQRVSADAPPVLPGTLTFQSDRGGRAKVFTLSPGEGHVRAVTHGDRHHDEQPAWSPDGARLAVATTRFDASTYAIALMRADGSGARHLAAPSVFDREPAWAPDGRTLYFSSEREGTQAVYQVDTKDGAVSRVSAPGLRAHAPAVSPDGSSLAYTVADDDGFQIEVQDVATGRRSRVTTAPDGATRPAWAPDGGRLLYTRLPPGGAFLEVRHLASGDTVPIAIDGYPWTAEAAWSPDGRWIAIAATQRRGDTENWDLFVVPAVPNGTAWRLTDGRVNDRAPSWHR